MKKHLKGQKSQALDKTGKRGFPKHLINGSQILLRNSKMVIDTGRKLTADILTNQGVKLGCSLLPTLFNVCIDGLIRKLEN